MRTLLRVFLAAIPLFLIGCATMVTRPMPKALDKQFDKALVIVNTGSLDTTTEAEKEIIWNLDAERIGAVASVEIMSLVRKYTDEQIQHICAENSIDSIVYIAVVGEGEKKVEIPATYGGFANNSFAVANGHGSFMADVPYVDIKIQLIDASNNSVVWETQSRVNSNDFKGDVASIVRKELRASNLFRPQWEETFLFRRHINYKKQ